MLEKRLSTRGDKCCPARPDEADLAGPARLRALFGSARRPGPGRGSPPRESRAQVRAPRRAEGKRAGKAPSRGEKAAELELLAAARRGARRRAASAAARDFRDQNLGEGPRIRGPEVSGRPPRGPGAAAGGREGAAARH